MPLLVTSAAGANGNGYGALLAFDREGEPLGAFSNDARLVDPRGLAVDPKKRCSFSIAAAIASWPLIAAAGSYAIQDQSRN